MDFREICEFFGGSIFIEEPRGNLMHSHEMIKRREASITDASSDEKAAVLLLKLIQSALVGNFVKYEDGPNFQECMQPLLSGIFGARWKFRAQSYILLVASWQLYPPLFRFCTILRGPSSMLLHAKYPIHAYNSHLATDCLEELDNVEPLDELEFRIIREVWTVSHRALEAARVSNPSYLYHNQDSKGGDFDHRVFENCCTRLAEAKDLADALNFETISNYAERLILEVRQAQGTADSEEDIKRLEESYESSGDKVGAGICCILRGDANVSSPFTNPIALNLLPVDGWDYLRSDTCLNELEHVPIPPQGYSLADNDSTKDLPSRLDSLNLGKPIHDGFDDVQNWKDAAKVALICYGEAQDMFSSIGAVRGQALAISRKACLLLTQELLPSYYWEEKDARAFEKINLLYQQACDLFSAAGDVMFLKLTQMHMLLLASHANKNIHELKYSIGAWGHENGASTYARQLGLLAFRLGDHLLYACGFGARARLAYECAQSVLSEIPEQQTPFFQLQCAVATLHLSTGNTKAAKLYVSIAKVTFEHRVKPEIDEVAEKDVSWAAANVFFASMLSDLLIASSQQCETANSMRRVCLDQLALLESDNLALSLREWIRRKRAVVEVCSLLLEYEEDLDRGDWASGEEKLKNLLEQSNAEEGEDIDTKIARVDMCLRLRDLNMARTLLDAIDECELLTEFKMGLASLGNFSDTLYGRRRSIRAIERILQRCINAQDWPRAARLMQLLESISPDHFLFPGNYSELTPWRRFLWAGLIEEAQEKHELAYRSFRQSWLVLQSERNSFVNIEAIEGHEYQNDYGRVAASLARFHLRRYSEAGFFEKIQPRKVDRRLVRIIERWNNELQMKQEAGAIDALEALERGKSLLMAQQLSFNAEALLADVELWDQTHHRFETWFHLQSLKRPRTKEEEEEYQRLDRASLETELAANPLNVDKRPLSEQVLQYPEVLSGIPSDAVVVYISLSDDGLAVFAVDRTCILSGTWNPDISESATRQMVARYVGDLAKDRDDTPDTWLEALALSISQVVIVPVEAHIREKNHIIFVPSGDLARFPLGALMIDDHPLILQKAVSQVPSLSALCHLSRRPVSKSLTVSVIARPGSVREEVASREPALPMAGIEALLVSQTFGSTPLHAADITKHQFREEMRKCSIMHLSTHGYFDSLAPMLSYISLKEKFRVIDMLTVRTKAYLVIFSACVSGTGMTNMGDDVLGFSHATLAAGAHVYMGSLWAANDIITMIHMMMFYTEIASTEEPKSMAEFWSQATRMLYFAEPHHILDLLKGFIARWDIMVSAGMFPDQFVRNGRRKLQKVIDEWITPSGEPVLNLKHPYFWANFAMIGNAQLMMHAAQKDS